MTEMIKNFGHGPIKAEIFDKATKQLILQTIKDGITKQTQDSAEVDEFTVYDAKTNQQVLKVRESYSANRSTITYGDKVYTKKDRHFITGDINHRLTDAESPESTNSINETDFVDIFTAVAYAAMKSR